MVASYKHLFTRALGADPERVHFAAHSHHLWPDASFTGHQRAWEDAARLADKKWGRVFGEVWPAAQKHVARLLGLPQPDSVVFASNTHELLVRIVSAMPSTSGPRRVLTSGSEFHSFRRQAQRYEEAGAWQVTRIAAEPFDTFASRFGEALAQGSWDLVFLSHVFFDSAFVVPDLPALFAQLARAQTYVIVDGYHGFCEVPTDFGPLADRAFYLAGGYKYAMSGEGVCFAHVPVGFAERPVVTGWFASFDTLASAARSETTYAEGASRLLGSTFDPTSLYRFVAVMDRLAEEGLSVEVMRAHGQRLARAFVDYVGRNNTPHLDRTSLLVADETQRGRFLTYRTERATAIQAALEHRNILCDSRGDRLRFGFGLYHDESDVVAGAARVHEVLRTFV